jgi:hypothetical protein
VFFHNMLSYSIFLRRCIRTTRDRTFIRFLTKRVVFLVSGKVQFAMSGIITSIKAALVRFLTGMSQPVRWQLICIGSRVFTSVKVAFVRLFSSVSRCMSAQITFVNSGIFASNKVAFVRLFSGVSLCMSAQITFVSSGIFASNKVAFVRLFASMCNCMVCHDMDIMSQITTYRTFKHLTRVDHFSRNRFTFHNR